MKGLLQNKRDQVQAMQEEAARTQNGAAAQDPGAASLAAERSKSNYTALSIVAGFGVLASALAALYLRLRRRPTPWRAAIVDGASATADWGAGRPAAGEPAAGEPAVGGPAVGGPAAGNSAPGESLPGVAAADPQRAGGMAASTAAGTQAAAQGLAENAHHRASGALTQSSLGASEEGRVDESTQPLLPIISAGESARRKAPAADPTVNVRVDTLNLRIDPTRLDYNLVDLDMTAQHVHMPSVLNEQVVVKERRTNLADVLRLAIEREPDRHDLRMKLLELYYSAAATNRQAFLEVVQKFARDRDYLHSDQWDKIAFMGRQIASENPLFAEETAADDIADCA
jgi:hypothetical protein